MACGVPNVLDTAAESGNNSVLEAVLVALRRAFKPREVRTVEEGFAEKLQNP